MYFHHKQDIQENKKAQGYIIAYAYVLLSCKLSALMLFINCLPLLY